MYASPISKQVGTTWAPKAFDMMGVLSGNCKNPVLLLDSSVSLSLSKNVFVAHIISAWMFLGMDFTLGGCSWNANCLVSKFRIFTDVNNDHYIDMHIVV